MKKSFLVVFGTVLVGVSVWATGAYLPKFISLLKGLRPVVTPAPAINLPDLSLRLPPGFAIEILAKDLPGARAMRFDPAGNLWVSQTSEGQVSLLEFENGKVVQQNVIFRNLKKPHGLVFDPQDSNVLYFAEEHQISKVTLNSPLPSLAKEGSRGEFQKIVELPCCGGHFTRTIGFGPDGRLYVSIGSSCNVCQEKDQRRAAIYSMNKDGSDFKPSATGLRNAVFFTWNEIDGRLWATEMGRDNLGDDLPPDEINIIEEGKNYGWPDCYGKTFFDKEFNGDDDCQATMSSEIDLPAHSAPLGLAFIPVSTAWPEDYWDDLLVAYHGSWNRSEPTGYKVVRVKLDEKGSFQGLEDFISGWLAEDGKTALGRPVDILIQPNGVMYISDDKAGVIYKLDRIL